MWIETAGDRKVATSHLLGEGRLMGLAYLLVALPLVLLLSYLNPPFQSPDEPNHAFRAAMLAGGDIVGTRTAPEWSGGTVPANAVKVMLGFLRPLGSRETFDLEKLRELKKITWDDVATVHESFTNTVIYPPFFYTPAVAAFVAGRHYNFSILNSLYMARAANGVLAVLIAAWAIVVAGRGRPLLFAVLSLPMTLFLFSSVSQDGLIIAGAALVAGLYSRAVERCRRLTAGELVICAVVLGALAAARPPYAPFLLLLLISPARVSRPRDLWSAAASPLAFVFAAAIAVGWILFGAEPVRVPMRSSVGVSVQGQLQFLADHPLAGLTAFARTLWELGPWHVRQLIGAFGAAEVDLYPAFYVFAGIVLALTCAAALAGPTDRAVARAPGGLLPLAAAIAILAAFGGIYAIQYLTWTQVGFSVVDGIQGRYFVPLLAFVPLVLLGFRPGYTAGSVRVRRVGAGAAVFLLCAAAVVTPWSISRYYYF
jgi:uncharacterized membrane protein